MSESAPPPASPGSTTSPPPAAASTKTPPPPPPGVPAASNSPPPSSSSSPPAPPASTPPPAGKAPPPAPPASTPPPAGKAPPPAAEPPPTPPSDPELSPPPPIPTSSTPPPSPPAQPAIPVPPPPLANPTPPLSPPPPSPPAVLPLPPPASPSGTNASPPPPAIAVPTAPTVPIDTPTPPSSKPAPPPPAASVVTPPSSPNTKSPSNPTPEPSNSTGRPIPATPVQRNASTSADASSSSNVAPVRPSSQSSPPASSRSSGTGVVVGLAAVAAVALVVFVFLFLKRKRRNDDFWKGHKHSLNGFSPKNRKRGPAAAAAPNTVEKSYRIYVGDVLDSSVSKPLFTYEELTSITNGFSPDNVIGEGGFGAVYKGVLPDGRQVAVKQLKPGSGQGEREFRAEVEIISRIHHRHLVSLVGYCTELHRLLVYEFVANNTLDHHLHVKGLPVLDWSNRMKIAIGSARGLAYLHEDCNPRIIHRDIKSANILLDESFEAKVADFGLAKLTNDTSTHISTRVMGTFGYLAPEYAFSGKLTDKSDVYSFGVVLLELVTGRKPVDPSLPSGDGSLVEWARPLLVHALETGECEHLVDPRLENNYVKKDMLRAIQVATACVRHSAPKRPRMVQVLRALDSRGSMPDLSNGVKFGESTVYNSSQYSADIQQLRRMAFQRDTFTIDFENSGAQGHGSSSTAYSAAMDGRGGN